MIKTRIVKVDACYPEPKLMKEAAMILRNGGLAIIPTETVYGIAAHRQNKKTLDRLYEIKHRPLDKPFSLLIVEKIKTEDFAKDVPPSCYRLMEEFWPGPLTLVLKSKEEGSIGLRMPNHKVAQAVIALAGIPLVCPSANISGKPAPTNFKQAIADMKGLVDFAIDAGSTALGIESSVVDGTIEPPQMLREGAIKQEEILKVAQRKTILFICTGNSCRSVMAEALLEKILKEKNRNHVEVLSAGIMMMAGLGASQETIEVLRREGMDVSRHRSQRVTAEMIKKSDLILVMEKLQEERILEIVPEAKNRLFLLKEFAKIEGDYLDILDPVGHTLEFYERTFGVIKEAVERVAQII